MSIEDPLVERIEPDDVRGVPMDRTAVAKGFAWTALFSLVGKIVFPLAGILLIARKLGPGVTGVVGLMQTTLMIADVIRDAGLTQSYLVEKTLDRAKEASYGGLALITGLLPTAVLLALTVPMARYFEQPALLYAIPWTAACLLMSTLMTIPNARLLRKGEIRVQGLLNVVANGVALLVAAVLVRGFGLGVPALVAQMVVGGFVNLLLTLRREPLPGIRIEWASLVDVFRRSRALLGANLLNNLFLFTDILFIQRLAGTQAVGLYNSAQNIAYKPADLISFPLSRTLSVAFSQSSGDLPKLARAYYRSVAAIVLFVIPIYVFIGLGSDTIVRLLYGPKYLGAIPVLSALSIYLAFRTLGNISGNALVPAGRHAWTLYPWFAALAATGAGLWYVSKSPSLMGVVWSYVAGSVVVYGLIFLLTLWFVRGDRGLYLRVGRAAATTAATSLVILACFQVPVVGWLRFLLAGALGLLVHLVAIGLGYGLGAFGVMSKSGVREAWSRL